MTTKTKIIRVAGIVMHQGRILVALSKYGNEQFYLCPGGKVEPFENIREATKRELKEETNCDLEVGELLYVREWINEEENADVLDLFFHVKFESGEVTHLNDPCLNHGVIQTLEWIPIEKLQTIDFEPKMLIHHLQKDFCESFKNRTIYIGASK